ncbi:hypothetical protein D3C80_1620090 [compost metagenome]
MSNRIWPLDFPLLSLFDFFSFFALPSPGRPLTDCTNLLLSLFNLLSRLLVELSLSFVKEERSESSGEFPTWLNRFLFGVEKTSCEFGVKTGVPISDSISDSNSSSDVSLSDSPSDDTLSASVNCNDDSRFVLRKGLAVKV